MKKNTLNLFAMLLVFLSFYSCRNEDFANITAKSKREEIFFKNAHNAPHLNDKTDIVKFLKNQNQKNHFITKMMDQNGLPIWNKIKVTTSKRTETKIEEEDFENLIIPLSENNTNLSSILYITKNIDGTFSFNNIDNKTLKEIIYDETLDKSYREKLYSSFIITDYLNFGTTFFWNAPPDLFDFIPETTHAKNRGFRIEVSEPETNNLYTTIICVVYYVECGHCDEVYTPVTKCWQVHVYDNPGGETGGGNHGNTNPPYGNGNTSGENPPSSGGGGSGSTGNPNGGGQPQQPQNPDIPPIGCGPNQPFYRPMPGCDDGEPMDTPCDKLKAKLISPLFKEKFNSLNKESIFSMNKERGFFERAAPPKNNLPSTFIQIDGQEGTHGLDLPENIDGIVGLLHSHNNESNGNPTIKIFSPTDVRTFINVIMPQTNSYLGSYTMANSTVLTSMGNYSLQFSQEIHPGGINYDTWQEWKTWYKREYEKLIFDNNLTQVNVEKVFTQFLKEIVNIEGLEVYRITNNTPVKLEYNGKNKPIKETPCP